MIVSAYFGGGGDWGGGGSEGAPNDEVTVTKLLHLSYGESFGTKVAKFFCKGPKVVRNLPKKKSFKNCSEAHQIDQPNVVNAKMYVVGAKNNFFFKGQKW